MVFRKPELACLRKDCGGLTSANWFGILSTVILLATIGTSIFVGQYQVDIDFLDDLQNKYGLECTDIGVGDIDWELDVKDLNIRDFAKDNIANNDWVPEEQAKTLKKGDAYFWDIEQIKDNFDRIHASYEADLKDHVGNPKGCSNYIGALKDELTPNVTKMVGEGLGYGTTGLGLLQAYHNRKKERAEMKLLAEKIQYKSEVDREHKEAMEFERSNAIKAKGKSCNLAHQIVSDGDKQILLEKKLQKDRTVALVMLGVALTIFAVGMALWCADLGGKFGQKNEAFKTLWLQGLTYLGLFGGWFLHSQTEFFKNKKTLAEEAREYKKEARKAQREYITEIFNRRFYDDKDTDVQTQDQAMKMAREMYMRMKVKRQNELKEIKAQKKAAGEEVSDEPSRSYTDDSWERHFAADMQEAKNAQQTKEPGQDGQSGHDEKEPSLPSIDPKREESTSNKSRTIESVNPQLAAMHEEIRQIKTNEGKPLVFVTKEDEQAKRLEQVLSSKHITDNELSVTQPEPELPEGSHESDESTSIKTNGTGITETHSSVGTNSNSEGKPATAQKRFQDRDQNYVNSLYNNTPQEPSNVRSLLTRPIDRIMNAI